MNDIISVGSPIHTILILLAICAVGAALARIKVWGVSLCAHEHIKDFATKFSENFDYTLPNGDDRQLCL